MTEPQAESFGPPTEWFGAWLEPERLLEAVLRHNEAVPAEEQFGRPGLKPLNEAYAAAKFGTIRSQSTRAQSDSSEMTSLTSSYASRSAWTSSS
jgi:hypothetical protein